MSRTNTAAYESIKASQLVFQNPDRTFPEPGAILSIDNLRGATTWSRNLDVDSVALAGPSSVGTLTYNNQLLVNGIPISGGGGANSGYNITVAGGAVNMDIQHDISMNRNSIQDCSSITIVAQYGTPGTFRSIGTDILLNKPFMVASSPYGRLILKGNTADQASLTFAEGTKTLTMVSPKYEFKTSASGGNVIAIDASSQLYVDVSAGSFANVLGYDVATGAVRYQPATTGGADVSGGSNIAVDLSDGLQIVSLDVREDIDMNSNSIVRCKTIELPRIPNTSSAKITFGDMSINKYGIISYEDSVNTLLITADTNVEVSGSNGKIIVGALGISGESYNGKSITNIVKSGYTTKVSSMELNAFNTLVVGATDISSAAPTLTLVDNTGSGAIRYVNPNIQTSKSVQVYTPNPQIVLQDSTVNRVGVVSFAGGSETINISAKNFSLISESAGSITIDSYGKTTSIRNARIADTIISLSGDPVSAAILTPDNTFTIGSIDISSNPVLRFQGGKASNYLLDASASIEYFDASGVEQLRLTSKNYAFNAVTTAGTALPTVLGYDTSSGEIKVQPAGISPLTGFTYDASGASLSISGSSSLQTFTPSKSGVYSITFSIALSNSSGGAIQFNNTFEAFRLGITPGFAYPIVRVSGIQNRVNAGAGTPTTDIYGTTIMEMLTAGITYSIQASHETTSLVPSSSTWASCIPRVRIAKLC